MDSFSVSYLTPKEDSDDDSDDREDYLLGAASFVVATCRRCCRKPKVSGAQS